MLALNNGFERFSDQHGVRRDRRRRARGKGISRLIPANPLPPPAAAFSSTS